MYKSSLTKALAVMAFAVFALASCQQEEATTPDGFNPSLSQRTQNCNTDCLEPGEFSQPSLFTSSYQNGQTVTIGVSNSTTQICYKVTSSTTIKYINLNGTELYCSTAAAPQPFVYCITNNLEKCDVVADNWNVKRQSCTGTGNGQEVIMNTSHTIIGACEGCKEDVSISGSGLTWTFCYKAENALTNAKVRFTCPHILAWECDKTLIRIDQGQGKGNQPTVLEWTGDLDQCEETCWTITFTPDCSLAESGKANLCTDFKVNGVSVAEAPMPIKYNCPE